MYNTDCLINNNNNNNNNNKMVFININNNNNNNKMVIRKLIMAPTLVTNSFITSYKFFGKSFGHFEIFKQNFPKAKTSVLMLLRTVYHIRI